MQQKESNIFLTVLTLSYGSYINFKTLGLKHLFDKLDSMQMHLSKCGFPDQIHREIVMPI